MVQIKVESIEVYAMINYLRDRCIIGNEGSWDKLREEYMQEASQCEEYVLTIEEARSIIESLKDN